MVKSADRGTVTRKDAVYHLEPVNREDSSLTSPHYVIIADRSPAPNTSCGIHTVEESIVINVYIF